LKPLLLSLITAILLTATSLAGGPVFWELSERDEIEKGDAQGVSIAENGNITLAPAFDAIFNTGQAYVWSSVADRAENIYLGTGHEGRIYKVDASGKGSLLVDTEELDVTALAVDSKGNLYAATSPDGKVYRIGADGKSSVFFDPEDKYIWSLIFDSSDTLYAGTGDKGKIYKVDQNGKGEVLADTNETNIMALALDNRGYLIAGTEPSGLVLRVDQQGKTFALLDSPMREIHSLLSGQDGSIYALGISGAAAGERLSAGISAVSAVSAPSITVTVVDDDQSGIEVQSGSASKPSSNQSRNDTANSKSVIHRIAPDGGSEIFWNSRDMVGFGIALANDGRVLVGTGAKGRIYAIAPDRSSTLLVQSTEDQTSTLLRSGENLYATSSNLGKLFRLGKGPGQTGAYESPVRDAKFVSVWGNISWRGAGVQLQTRSGNTETPDVTWSDWSPTYSNSQGTRIASPPARFLQWRATLKDAPTVKPQLQSVRVAYLPRNIAPEVISIEVLPPGVALQEMPQQPVDPGIASSGLSPQVFGLVANIPPRKVFQKGVRSLSWRAEDLNGDDLRYQIYYRAINDQEWHLLKGDINNNYYSIDADALPDGTYFFRIVASDSPSNPQGRALTGERISEEVEIDNTPPEVRAGAPRISGNNVSVSFAVADTTTAIRKADYSIDGGEWKLIFPDDGIADSRQESYTLSINLSPGEHSIAFRCSDRNANVGTSKLTVRIPR